MKCLVIETFNRRGEPQTPGSIIEVPEAILPKLAGYVRPVASADDYDDLPKAWLVNGELRTRGHIPDLAAEIIKLTADNLPEQKRLLRLHVERYSLSGNRFAYLAEEWEERAGIMEFDGGMSREEAELEAAKIYRLEAFLPELRNKGYAKVLPSFEN